MAKRAVEAIQSDFIVLEPIVLAAKNRIEVLAGRFADEWLEQRWSGRQTRGELIVTEGAVAYDGAQVGIDDASEGEHSKKGPLELNLDLVPVVGVHRALEFEEMNIERAVAAREPQRTVASLFIDKESERPWIFDVPADARYAVGEQAHDSGFPALPFFSQRDRSTGHNLESVGLDMACNALLH